MVHDNLFDDRKSFICFFLDKSNAKHKDLILVTDKLKYWYCRHIDHSCGLGSKITSSAYAFLYCYYVKELSCLTDILKAGESKWWRAYMVNRGLTRKADPAGFDGGYILSCTNGVWPCGEEKVTLRPVTAGMDRSGRFFDITAELESAGEKV